MTPGAPAGLRASSFFVVIQVRRLVVVADQEDPRGRSGERERQLQLGGVDVLDLVDEQVRAAVPPAGEERRVLAQAGESARHEVVEIDRPGRRETGRVARRRGAELLRHRPGPRVQLGARDRVVEDGPSFTRHVRPELAQDDRAVRDDGRAVPAVPEDLEPQGVERRDRDCPRRHAERQERRVQALAELGRGPAVERHRADPVGRIPSAIRTATRATSVVVFPAPAGATQRTGPGGAVAAPAGLGRVARGSPPAPCRTGVHATAGSSPRRDLRPTGLPRNHSRIRSAHRSPPGFAPRPGSAQQGRSRRPEWQRRRARPRATGALHTRRRRGR